MKTIKGDLILTKNTVFNESITVEGNIICKGGPWDIDAGNINAGDIDARDIDYYAVCFARNSFKCKSIKGRRNNSKHFCLDSKIKIERSEA